MRFCVCLCIGECVQIYLVKEAVPGDPTTATHGKITFCDLAGSENLKQSKAEGVHQKETAHINKSLFCLGTWFSGC